MVTGGHADARAGLCEAFVPADQFYAAGAAWLGNVG
jgi:hypothetical protein